jgi:hypothetical protein
MSIDLERRLTDALEARANLVRSEDLRHGTVPGHDAEPDHPRWRRVAAYTAAVAACAAAIAVPVWLTDTPRSAPEPTPAPEGWVGGIGRTGVGAQLPASRQTADVDGDGAPDTVWVRSKGRRVPGPVRVEVLLSTTPDEVRWTVLDLEAQSAGVEGAAQLDADPGEELVISTEDGSTFTDAVVDFVDGRLQQVPASEPDMLRSTTLTDGRTRTPRVEAGRLLTWTSQERLRDDTEFARVDVTWWTIGDEHGRPTLVADGRDEQCIDLTGMRFGPCLAGNVPDADFPDVSGDNPSDVVPAFLPVVETQLDIGADLRFKVDGTPAVARLTGTPDDPTLEVEVGADTLTAELGAGDPARLLDGIVPGAAGPGLLVLRETGDATAWSVWSVRDDKLVKLNVSDEAPLGSGFLETKQGFRSYHTELSKSGLLWTAIGDPSGDSEIEDVWIWSLDSGPGVVATPQSCFRFPADGSDPAFAPC